MSNLEPLEEESTHKEKSFAVFDIETNGWDQFLVLGYWNGKKFRYFKSVEKFITFVMEKAKVKVVFAHNGGKFDFLFLLDRIYQQDKYEVVKLMERGSAILSFRLKWGDERTVHFTDTIAFLPYKLDSLTKTFGVTHKKLEIDHTKKKVINAELLEYLKHDCIGLYEVVEKYRSQELIKSVGMKYTTASQSIQVFRRYLKRPVWSLNQEDDAWARESYFGGRVEIFKPAFFGEKQGGKIRVFDVNSLYPTVMRDNEFPNQPIGMTKSLNLDSLSIWDVTVEVPKHLYVPPLGSVIKIPTEVRQSRRDGSIHKKTEYHFKYLFPVGRFRGKWTSAELKYALSLGVKILEVHEGMLFKSGGHLFRDFIEDMYARRLKAKESGDDVNDTISKLMMNSLYGRMGLDRDREEVMIDDGRTDAKIVEYDRQLAERGFNYRLIRVPSYLDSSFSNVAIASFVTSYARIHMHRIYMQTQADLYYTDTDSVFVTTQLPTGGDLGQVKEEAVGDRACFLLPKTYILEGDGFRKAAAKGMDKNFMKQYTVEDFYAMYEGEGRIIQSKQEARGLMGFRTAINRHGKFVMPKPEMVRKLMSTYDKRVVFQREDGTFDSRPIEVDGSEMSRVQAKHLERLSSAITPEDD